MLFSRPRCGGKITQIVFLFPPPFALRDAPPRALAILRLFLLSFHTLLTTRSCSPSCVSHFIITPFYRATPLGIPPPLLIFSLDDLHLWSIDLCVPPVSAGVVLQR